MVKTYEEYYNDPDIVDEPQAMREIHAIRLMQADERKEMTDEEYDRLANERVEAFLADFEKRTGKTIIRGK